jgi:hypothetical protein
MIRWKNGYNDLVGEGKRLTKLPSWVHLAQLTEVAETQFTKTPQEFYDDVEPPISEHHFLRQYRAYGIFRLLSAEQKDRANISNCHATLMALEAEDVIISKSEAQQTFELVEEEGPKERTLLACISHVSQAARILKDYPHLIEEATDKQLTGFIECVPALTAKVTKEIERRVKDRKKRKAA